MHSFIGLLNFYHRYVPFFEMTLKPLRGLERQYRRKTIPASAWTIELKTLFQELKEKIINSPLIARYDPSLPTFLKTDWSALGMGWILMQPARDTVSKAATQTLASTGECLFDLSLDGPRLLPVAFGSRSCTRTESHFHSFVGEICCGRWSIAQNKKFLWGHHFYWLCDCNTVQEVLDYDGSIHMIKRWSQELLGYQFSVVHRPAKMMTDVDALGRQFSPDIAEHLRISTLLHSIDKSARNPAYDPATFKTQPTRIFVNNDKTAELPLVPPLTKQQLAQPPSSVTVPGLPKAAPNDTPIMLHSCPVPLTHSLSNPAVQDGTRSTCTNLAQSDITDSLTWHHMCWIAVDDIIGNTMTWCKNQKSLVTFDSVNIFSSAQTSAIFNSLHSSEKIHISKMNNIITLIQSLLTIDETIPILGIDLSFVAYENGTILHWLQYAVNIILFLVTSCPNFSYSVLWIPKSFLSTSLKSECITILTNQLPSNWRFNIHIYNAQNFGASVYASRYCFKIGYDPTSTSDFFTTLSTSIPSHQAPPRIENCLHNSFTMEDFHLTQTDIILPLNILDNSTVHTDDATIIGHIRTGNSTPLPIAPPSSSCILHPDGLGLEPNFLH